MTNEKRDFNKEAATWDEPARMRMADNIGNAILREIRATRETDALDFGCGTGLLTLKLQPLARSVIGADSSKGMIDVLDGKIKERKLSNVKTRLINLDKGDSLEGNYQLITSSMTLHHIREISPLLDLFFKITSPDGYLCIADLDLDDGQFHGGNNVGVFHDGFDRAVLRKSFAAAGYTDIRDMTATTVTRPVPGGVRTFTVFLMIGRKPA
ncbi:MAG TPA: class I SAM-dependent methyltransferase [Methanocella sp.]|jgi:2-polyprenyl-3-methyl-5-hydroxy-6-metoxy-1,4-benzoquinol methylase